jgi:hypothetical protein
MMSVIITTASQATGLVVAASSMSRSPGRAAAELGTILAPATALPQ